MLQATNVLCVKISIAKIFVVINFKAMTFYPAISPENVVVKKCLQSIVKGKQMNQNSGTLLILAWFLN